MSKSGQKCPERRAPRFSRRENIVLLKEIECRLQSLTDTKEPSSMKAKHQAWNEIAQNVTAANKKGEIRTKSQVQTKWYDLKCVAKKMWKNMTDGDDDSTTTQAEFAQKMISIIRTKILTKTTDADDEFNDHSSNNDCDPTDCKKEGQIQNIDEQNSVPTNQEDYNQFQAVSSSFQVSEINPTITVRSISRNVMKNHVEHTLTNVVTAERTLTPDSHIERPLTSKASSDESVEQTLNPGAVVGQTFTTNFGRTISFNPAVETPLTPSVAVERTLTSGDDNMSLPYKLQKLKVEQQKLEVQRKLLNYLVDIQKGLFTPSRILRRCSVPTTEIASTSMTQELIPELVKSEILPENELTPELSDVYSKLPQVACNGGLENVEDALMNEYTSDSSEEGAVAPPPLKRKRNSTPSGSLPRQPTQNNVYAKDIKEILNILKESAKPPEPVPKDEDEQFMSSMATALKKIEPKTRYNIKMKIMKLIYEPVLGPESEQEPQS